MPKTTQETINNIVWRACDTFRGTMDSNEYKLKTTENPIINPQPQQNQ